MKQTILLVEDNPSIVIINKRTLELESYRVLDTATLSGAQEMLAKETVDLIVLDIMLPDGSGLEFCRHLRKTNTIPILFLTALDEKKHLLTGLKNGGDDYLPKPYDLDVLVMKIQSLLRRVEFDRQNKEVAAGPLLIDTGAHRVLLNGGDTGLTPKECDLLLYLVNHRDKLCSAEEIYEAVWRLPFNENPNAVKTHISSLRRKLNLDERRDLVIENEFRRGYRLRIRDKQT